MIAKNSARRLIQGGIVTNYLAAPIDKWGDLEQGAAIDVKMNFYEAFMQFRRICADYNTKTQLADMLAALPTSLSQNLQTG